MMLLYLGEHAEIGCLGVRQVRAEDGRQLLPTLDSIAKLEIDLSDDAARDRRHRHNFVGVRLDRARSAKSRGIDRGAGICDRRFDLEARVFELIGLNCDEHVERAWNW